MILRRKVVPEELRPAFESFRTTVRTVDEAKRCLTAVVPTTRLPGRPLADALAEFETLLGRARDEMSAWDTPDLADEWRLADRAIARSQDRAKRLREQASIPEGFESLISIVGALRIRWMRSTGRPFDSGSSGRRLVDRRPDRRRRDVDTSD